MSSGPHEESIAEAPTGRPVTVARAAPGTQSEPSRGGCRGSRQTPDCVRLRSGPTQATRPAPSEPSTLSATPPEFAIRVARCSPGSHRRCGGPCLADPTPKLASCRWGSGTVACMLSRPAGIRTNTEWLRFDSKHPATGSLRIVGSAASALGTPHAPGCRAAARHHWRLNSVAPLGVARTPPQARAPSESTLASYHVRLSATAGRLSPAPPPGRSGDLDLLDNDRPLHPCLLMVVDRAIEPVHTLREGQGHRTGAMVEDWCLAEHNPSRRRHHEIVRQR